MIIQLHLHEPSIYPETLHPAIWKSVKDKLIRAKKEDKGGGGGAVCGAKVKGKLSVPVTSY